MSTFYKIIFSLQTISIWLLFRKLGYFDGLSLHPGNLKKKIKEEKTKRSLESDSE